jgi:hypothetical protein
MSVTARSEHGLKCVRVCAVMGAAGRDPHRGLLDLELDGVADATRFVRGPKAQEVNPGAQALGAEVVDVSTRTAKRRVKTLGCRFLQWILSQGGSRSLSLASSARSIPRSWLSRMSLSSALPGVTLAEASCSSKLGQLGG